MSNKNDCITGNKNFMLTEIESLLRNEHNFGDELKCFFAVHILQILKSILILLVKLNVWVRFQLFGKD